jgi:hypothetical protein
VAGIEKEVWVVNYPNIEAVNEADRYQICYWWRFLPAPGLRAFKKSPAEFQKALDEDVIIINRIAERFKELGGFTPEISKSMGWG